MAWNLPEHVLAPSHSPHSARLASPCAGLGVWLSLVVVKVCGLLLPRSLNPGFRVSSMCPGMPPFSIRAFPARTSRSRGFMVPVSLSPTRTLEFTSSARRCRALSNAGACRLRHDDRVRRGTGSGSSSTRFSPAFRCQAVVDGKTAALVSTEQLFRSPNIVTALTTPDRLQLRRLADSRFAFSPPRLWAVLAGFLYCLELLAGGRRMEAVAAPGGSRLAVISGGAGSFGQARQSLTLPMRRRPGDAPGTCNIGAYYLIDRHRPSRPLAPGLHSAAFGLKHAFDGRGGSPPGGYSPFGRAFLSGSARGRCGSGGARHHHHDLTALT